MYRDWHEQRDRLGTFERMGVSQAEKVGNAGRSENTFLSLSVAAKINFSPSWENFLLISTLLKKTEFFRSLGHSLSSCLMTFQTFLFLRVLILFCNH